MPEKTVVKDSYSPTQFSQLPFDQIGKSQCPSDREFLTFFKTPHTFSNNVICKGVIANQNINS